LQLSKFKVVGQVSRLSSRSERWAVVGSGLSTSYLAEGRQTWGGGEKSCISLRSVPNPSLNSNEVCLKIQKNAPKSEILTELCATLHRQFSVSSDDF